jgi:hypothetical protein
MAGLASAPQFDPVAWWYTRQQIGLGLREIYLPSNDLPPQLLLLVGKLDDSSPRSAWLDNVCVLAFLAVILAASFRFHFVF